MNNRLLIFFPVLISIILLFTYSCGDNTDVDDPKDDKNWWEGTLTDTPIELADPYILYHDSVYYAYGTRHADGIQVYQSKDLKGWSRVINSRGGLALHKNDVSPTRNFWAPEVYYIEEQDRFLMYYSGHYNDNSSADYTDNDIKICCAWSDSPVGPFVKENVEFMLPGDLGADFNIDNHLFIDDDGTPYLYFVRRPQSPGGLSTWVAELEDDFVTVKTNTVKLCTAAPASGKTHWERIWPRVNEGPFVNKHNGTYYMTFSANSYESQDYAIGYATAPSPMGPWTKAEEHNPILRRPQNSKLVGTGHHGNFVDADGNLRIAFHAHKDLSSVHHRRMHISTVKFEPNPAGGPDIMVIDEEYMTPVFLK